MNILTLENISKRYTTGHLPAVDRIAFSMKKGEAVALLGESGSGKSTLLRLIAGLEIPSTGYIRLKDKTISAPDVFVPPEDRGIGMVFQDYALFPHYTVEKNIGFGLQRLSKPERRQRLQEMLDLTRLQALAGRFPHELSGGEQQRVALARSLAPAPDLLLLDEPFSSLDESLKTGVRDELMEIIRRANISTLLVTHDTEDALTVADRLVVLRQGRQQQTGAPEEVYQKPANRYVAEFMGPANFLPATRNGNGYQTEIGTVSGTAEPFSQALAVIRPQHFRLSDQDHPSAKRGILQRCKFLGTHFELTVALQSSGRSLFLRLANQPVPEIGSAVYLQADLQKVAIVPAEPDGRLQD